MNLFRRVFGKILYGISRGIDVVFSFLIDLLEFLIEVLNRVIVTVSSFFSLGCLFILLIVPFGLFYLSPILGPFLFIFIIVPLLLKGTRKLFIFLRYTLTEYLYGKSNYFIDGKKPKYSSIGDYAREYIEEEERRRQEQREKEAREQRERFRSRTFYGFDGFEGFNNTNQGYGQGPFNTGFKEKYEKACDTLGVPYDADKDQIRRAYREKAKMYHPDLNKDPGATEKFQKINDANEMLSEENMKMYKNLS